MPTFGYKIHISATPYNFNEILNIVIPYLENNKLSYKYIYEKDDILQNFSIKTSMSSSGKLITIYPKDQLSFQKILSELYDRIPKTTDGIYVMSDRSYRDSNNIFYRYGFFKEDINYIKDGKLTLNGPNGEIWQDYPKNYFELPSWIEDIQESDLSEESYLSEHYIINEVLKTSSGGNVYKGISKRNNLEIVMKEARPNILFYENIEKQQLRENEFQLSSNIKAYIPKAIESVNEWINHYYIYEYIDGKTFSDYCSNYTLYGYKLNKWVENTNKFKKLLEAFFKTLKLISHFHKNDLILNDIHPDNFKIDKNGNIYFVDLEHSYKYGKKPITGIFSNISLKEWNSLDGKVSDCHKVGNMILFLVGRLHIKRQIKEEIEILKQFLYFYGIDSNIDILIRYLFSKNPDINTAMKIMSTIYAKSIQERTILINPTIHNCKYDILKSPYLSIEELVYKHNKKYEKYIHNLDNLEVIKHFINNESDFGLDGLSGVLILLDNLSVDKDIINYGITEILSKSLKTNCGRMVKVSDKTASPYLKNGSAGFIKALCKIDAVEFRPLIEEFAEGLLVNFAQRPTYWDGMLGIADTLLDVYELTNCKKYLEYSNVLIISSSFYLNTSRIENSEFLTIYNRIQSIKEGRR